MEPTLKTHLLPLCENDCAIRVYDRAVKRFSANWLDDVTCPEVKP